MGAAGQSAKVRKLKPALRDPQAEAPAAVCGQCGGEVYAGERLFLWDGARLCGDCFRDRVLGWLRVSPVQVAEALGFEHEEL